MSQCAVRCVIFCLILAPLRFSAQDFKLDGREVQIHGFASQGFVHTDDNNWLTMDTSHVGSGEMTDVGVNASMQVSDKFRIGAQGFDRKLGQLGGWHPSVDWALADYKVTGWLGLRAGKVKTTIGLYNDTQDLEFLHTFALLPQSVYPTDLRDATIGHIGGDVYGMFALKRKLGDLSYTAYVGHRSDSIYSGYPYLLTQFDTHLTSMAGLQYGGDLRWNTPIKGFLLGASRMNQHIKGVGTSANVEDPSDPPVHYSEHSKADWTNQFYGSYVVKRMQFDSEYRRYFRDQSIFSGSSTNLADVRAWYISGTYRLIKRITLGSYYSRYTITSVYGGFLESIGVPNETDTSQPQNHIYDKVISLRVDPKKFWNIKFEGHFMTGYGASEYPDGFYPQVNPQGFRTDTNALVVMTGVSF
jgi:hypothetical protein